MIGTEALFPVPIGIYAVNNAAPHTELDDIVGTQEMGPDAKPGMMRAYEQGMREAGESAAATLTTQRRAFRISEKQVTGTHEDIFKGDE